MTASPINDPSAETTCINTIRTLCMDAVEKAGSGHPGAPMGLAPTAYVLWTEVLRHNPSNPDWPGRDRFVLSGGHASMLLYSLLHLTGYNLSLEEIRRFRQWGSRTPGHPEYGHTPGVETTTGPLGQGLANAVGMAMAERHLAARFNRDGYPVIDHFTYVICGDGDLMEGLSTEVASLAGHLGLGRLICLYDDNRICIEGSTALTFTEDAVGRFAACGWHVSNVADGNDTAAVREALSAAKAADDRPSLIAVRTEIAFGSPNKQGSAAAHGAPLGADEVALTKTALGWPADATFRIPPEAAALAERCRQRGRQWESEWRQLREAFATAHRDADRKLAAALKGELPAGWDSDLPRFSPDNGPLATRAASGLALNGLAAKVETLMGGSADLAPSNKTMLEGCQAFQHDTYQGRNIHFGVREHAMAAVMNGMALHGGLRPYGGTFLVFADYMRPAIRLAALMQLPVVYVLTHDSIAVGEDGPTHQPVEHLASLRAIPGLAVLRPADANEAVAAWRAALAAKGPVALVLSRQKLPVLERNRMPPAGEVAKGGYLLWESGGDPELILMASGSEVYVTLAAGRRLARGGIAVRVVNMACWEWFDAMPSAYRETVLPATVRNRLAVEAGIGLGWARYTGSRGRTVTVNGFGASAPGGQVMAAFGFSVDHIVHAARQLMGDH